MSHITVISPVVFHIPSPPLILRRGGLLFEGFALCRKILPIKLLSRGWGCLAQSKDGVQLYRYGHWKEDYAGRAWRIRTNGPAAEKYAKAGSWAEAQINKPYNLNFLNKFDTSRFYCSQLVWWAWKVQGFDIAPAALFTSYVSPAQIRYGNIVVSENI